MKNVVIVSGCMAVQARVKGNIQEQDIYHNKLKASLLTDHGIDIECHIVTFKDLSLWQDKVKALCGSMEVDLLIVQLRTHDHINLIRYGRTGEIHETFVSQDEHNDATRSNVSSFYRQLKSKLISKNNWFSRSILKLLKQINWRVVRTILLGKQLAKNKRRFATSEYSKVITDGNEIANTYGFPVLFLGVTSRPGSWLENWISKKLQIELREKVHSLDRKYVDVLGMYNSKKQYKFSEEGEFQSRVSLNRLGHAEVAEKLCDAMVEILDLGSGQATCSS